MALTANDLIATMPAAVPPASAIAPFDAKDAAEILKVMGHKERLQILSLIADGEKTVTELEKALGLRQPAVSQLLQRLRSDGLVEPRRAGKSIIYMLGHPSVAPLLGVLRQHFPL